MTSPLGYSFFHLTIMDELDHAIPTANITNVTVLTANTRKTVATLYTDGQANTSFTNPQTSFLEGSNVRFWGAATAYDVIVVLSNGVCVRQNNVTPSVNKVVVKREYLDIAGVPTVNASATGTITQYCFPNGPDSFRCEMHLSSVVVGLAFTATNGIAYGGTKLTDLPAGYTGIRGVMGELSLGMGNGHSQYFTDATPEGTLSVGNKVKDDAADCGASDAQDDNILKTTDFVMAAYADTTISLKAAEDNCAGSAQDVVVNASVDAADINDDMADAAEVQVSGILSFDVTHVYSS